jgi:sigma-B regulation protein RsbU (phosphoserine phosphatase)
MPRLTASERADLPDSAFAYIDARGRRRLPIHDAAHVRNALARFNQVAFEDEAARERARKRLLKAAKKHGIVPVGFITGQLQSERLEKEGMLKEMKEAEAIQAGLLPGQAPAVPHFRLDGVCLPCRTVGGDWYDYVPLPDGRVAVVLADVSGKGLGAALLMSSTRSILRLVAQDGRPPGAVLDAVNRVLVADLPASKFVTMIYAVLDPDRQTVTFANAGHLPPILVDAAGERYVKVKPALPLGIREGRYREHELAMPHGSRLVLYSDGVVEARNRTAEEYGTTRLLSYVGSVATSPQRLLDDVLAFTAEEQALDDITIVMVDALAYR